MVVFPDAYNHILSLLDNLDNLDTSIIDSFLW